MNFFFDHDVPEDAAFALKAMGYKVVRLREVLPTVTTDDEVFGYASTIEIAITSFQRMASRFDCQGGVANRNAILGGELIPVVYGFLARSCQIPIPE